MGPFNRDNMGDDARDYAITHSREGVDPREAVEDYGDYQSDYSRQEGSADESGAHWNSADEVEDFYDSLHVPDIRIL